MKLKKNKTATKIDLPEVLDAYQAEDFHQNLCEALERNMPITITGKEVIRADTLCCQLLTKAALECEEQNIKFELATPSSQLIKALSTLGVIDLFQAGTTV